jgi:hypothetical protein
VAAFSVAVEHLKLLDLMVKLILLRNCVCRFACTCFFRKENVDG